MGKVINLSEMEVTSSKEGYVKVDNIYMRDYFSMPLFSIKKEEYGKVEHGKNIFDIGLMYRYWAESECVKTNVSSIAELIQMDRRSVTKYIKSDLKAHEYGKRCQVYELEQVGKSIKLKIKHKPPKSYYTSIPMAIISSNELTPLAKKVYMILLYYANNDECVAWASRTTIAKSCGCEKASVTNAVKELEKEGFLEYVTVKKPNGHTKNFYKPLIVVENNSVVTLSKNIYVSPSNVHKAIGVYIAIGEKIEEVKKVEHKQEEYAIIDEVY